MTQVNINMFDVRLWEPTAWNEELSCSTLNKRQGTAIDVELRRFISMATSDANKISFFPTSHAAW